MRLFIPLVFIIFLFGCKSDPVKKTVQIPEDIIPPAKMEKVLTDVQLIESALVYQRSNRMSYLERKDFYYAYLCDKYGISKDELDKSLEFYKSQTILLEEMYRNIVSEIEKLKGEPPEE